MAGGHESVGGERADSTKRPSRQYAQGRECKAEDCTAELSRYNPGEYCALHRDQRDKKAESMRDRY